MDLPPDTQVSNSETAVNLAVWDEQYQDQWKKVFPFAERQTEFTSEHLGFSPLKQKHREDKRKAKGSKRKLNYEEQGSKEPSKKRKANAVEAKKARSAKKPRKDSGKAGVPPKTPPERRTPPSGARNSGSSGKSSGKSSSSSKKQPSNHLHQRKRGRVLRPQRSRLRSHLYHREQGRIHQVNHLHHYHSLSILKSLLAFGETKNK